MAEYKVIRVNPTGQLHPNVDVLERHLNDGYELIHADSVQGESRSGNPIISTDYLLRKRKPIPSTAAQIEFLRECLKP